mmetsp:Transcript_38647/g.114835  ORF Transcript_38647/g.114835 Transcript_38647/m.114835 type:complete len:288 (+) Transcript_38647:183-1046(+)
MQPQAQLQTWAPPPALPRRWRWWTAEAWPLCQLVCPARSLASPRAPRQPRQQHRPSAQSAKLRTSCRGCLASTPTVAPSQSARRRRRPATAAAPTPQPPAPRWRHPAPARPEVRAPRRAAKRWRSWRGCWVWRNWRCCVWRSRPGRRVWTLPAPIRRRSQRAPVFRQARCSSMARLPMTAAAGRPRLHRCGLRTAVTTAQYPAPCRRPRRALRWRLLRLTAARSPPLPHSHTYSAHIPTPQRRWQRCCTQCSRRECRGRRCKKGSSSSNRNSSSSVRRRGRCRPAAR